MRVNRSPTGSFMGMVRSSLPARLHEAGDQPFRAEFTERDARQLVLAVIGARPAGQFAAVADARRRRIARQFSELQARREALLDRLRLIVDDRFQPRPPAGKLLRHPAAPVVLLD